VDGIVVDGDTRTGIANASVIIFDSHGERFRTRTAASGLFQFSSAEPGLYHVAIETNGFILFRELRVAADDPPVFFTYEIEFGKERKASVSGQVLDSKNRPSSFAKIDLIRGPSLRYRVTADQAGRFMFSNISPGSYNLRALPQSPPNGNASDQKTTARSAEVATYFPSSLTEIEAQRIEVHGATRVEGFWTRTAPVHSVSGVVKNDDGSAAAETKVQLVPIFHRSAHVISSFDSFFFVSPGGSGPGPDQAEAFTDKIGRFEFADVPAGAWRVVAGSREVGVALTPVEVREADLTLQLRLHKSPKVLAETRWGVFCVQGRLFCGQRPIQNASFPIWFTGNDGQESGLMIGYPMQDHGETSVFFDVNSPGSFSVRAFPPIVESQILWGTSIAFQPASGQDFEVARPKLTVSISLMQGGSELLNMDRPVALTAENVRTAMAASLSGTVRDGVGASVILLPVDFSSNYGGIAICGKEGNFEFRNLRPGAYYAAAFRNLDMEELRDLEIIQRTQINGRRVRLDAVRPNPSLQIEEVLSLRP
jgi:hypothetical protein